MKKFILSRVKKGKGESSSHSSHHSDERRHGREEEEVHQLVPHISPSRALEPESSLLLTQEELGGAEEEEVSSMDVSMGRPPRSRNTSGVHTPRPCGSGRRQPRSEVDELIDNMSNLHVE